MKPTSITDYLASLGRDSSYGARANLATQYGIKDYAGTADQNNLLLNIVKGQGGQTNTPAYSTPVPQSQSQQSSYKSQTYAPASVIDQVAEAQRNKNQLSVPQSQVNPYNQSVPMTPVPSYQTPAYQPQSYSITRTVEELPRVTKDVATAKIASSGLFGTGIKASEYEGMDYGQAQSKINERKQALLSQSSQNSSAQLNQSSFNPTAAKSVVDKATMDVKTSYVDPFKTNEDKNNDRNTIIENATAELAKNFSSPTQFDIMYNTNPAFKNMFDTAEKGGITRDAIKAKIAQPEYNLSTGNETYDKLLSTDTATAKEQIKYLQGVPEQYREAYLGDSGLYSQLKEQATARLKEVETNFKNVTEGTKEAFNALEDKNEAEETIELAKLEEKRIDNKNLMMSKLASLGALTTTGAAPEALARLDSKYDQLASTARTAYQAQRAEARMKRTQAISDLETQYAEKKDKITSDLTKSSFEIEKELLNLEKESRKDINDVIIDWNKEAKAVQKEYLKKAGKLSTDYSDKWFSTASGGLSKDVITPKAPSIAQQKTLLQQTLTSGIAPDGTQIGNPRGADGYVDPGVYMEAFNNWTGTAKEFLTAFPIERNVNPASYSLLPASLQPIKKASSSREL